MVLEWTLTIALSIVAPIVIYDVATDHGVAEFPALALACLGPAVELVTVWAWRRRLDEISTVAMTFLLATIVISLVSRDPRALLLREAAVLGLYGLFLLATVPTPWPLCFFFGRRFATGGDPDKVAWWNDLWRYPRFRRTQRLMTTMWGATLLAEGVVRAVLVYRLPVRTMVVVNSTVPYLVLATLIVITIVWGKREQARGEAAQAAAQHTAEAST